MAAPSITGTPVSQTFSSSSTWTKSYTTPGTGTNTGILVLVAEDQTDDDPASVTFNGTGLTKIASFNGLGVQGTTFWFLANPPTTTANVVVNLSPSSHAGQIHIISLQDVDQVSPVNVSGQSGSAGATSQSCSINTSVINTLVISALSTQFGSSFSVGGGQTLILSSTETGSTINFISSQSTQASPGSVTHSYSWTVSAANDIAMVALKSPGATTNGNFLMMF